MGKENIIQKKKDNPPRAALLKVQALRHALLSAPAKDLEIRVQGFRYTLVQLLESLLGPESLVTVGDRTQVRWTGQLLEEKVIDDLLNLKSEGLTNTVLMDSILQLVGCLVSARDHLMIGQQEVPPQGEFQWPQVGQDGVQTLRKFGVLLPGSVSLAQARLHALALCRMLVSTPRSWRGLPPLAKDHHSREVFVFWHTTLDAGQDRNMWQWSLGLLKKADPKKSSEVQGTTIINYGMTQALEALLAAAAVARLALHGAVEEEEATNTLVRSSSTSAMCQEYLDVSRVQSSGLLRTLGSLYALQIKASDPDPASRQAILGTRQDPLMALVVEQWESLVTGSLQYSSINLKSAQSRAFSKEAAKGSMCDYGDVTSQACRQTLASRDLDQLERSEGWGTYAPNIGQAILEALSGSGQGARSQEESKETQPTSDPRPQFDMASLEDSFKFSQAMSSKIHAPFTRPPQFAIDEHEAPLFQDPTAPWTKALRMSSEKSYGTPVKGGEFLNYILRPEQTMGPKQGEATGNVKRQLVTGESEIATFMDGIDDIPDQEMQDALELTDGTPDKDKEPVAQQEDASSQPKEEKSE